MPAPSVSYAQIATTVAALKAITADNRASNFCLFLPEIGSWVYYSGTSTATADNVHVFAPNDGVGRWLVTNQLPYFAAANSAIATHNAANNNNPHAQYQNASQVGAAANSAIATHNAANNNNPHAQYQNASQVGAAANSAIATHNAATDPHTQYHRRDGVLTANQPNAATPAFSARVATGSGSSSGGFQVLTPTGNPAVSLGADSVNRGVITAGTNGLVVGGTPTERLSFWGGSGGSGATRPNAIALAGANTTDTQRAINDVITALRTVGFIAP